MDVVDLGELSDEEAAVAAPALAVAILLSEEVSMS
jgi:hypothetical protein